MLTLGRLPEANLIRGRGGKSTFIWVSNHGPDAFFVVSQRLYTFSVSNVPKFDQLIVAASDDLRLIRLADY